MKKRSEYLNKIKRPIPYYGSKEKIAQPIVDIIKKDNWSNQYIEPFVGSNSILLQDDFDGIKVIINDFDGKITNIWRSLKYKPDETAGYIQGVCNSINLTGLDLAIQRSYDSLLDRLHADIDYCDPKLAAHFMDICCLWIGGGAGNAKGPWTTIKDEDNIDILVRKEKGDIVCKQAQYSSDRCIRGINCQQAQYDSDRGINCQQAQYGSDRGINAKHSGISAWFNAISKRLSDTYILSLDFERILNMYVIISKRTTIFLDPPYDSKGNAGNGVDYITKDGDSISKRTRDWCIKNHDALNKTRIILAGRGNEHDELLNYGYEKINGINIKSLNKNVIVNENTQEYLWVKYND